MAFEHLAHFVKNTGIYIVYRHSAKKYRDMIFHSYRPALICVYVNSVMGASLVSEEVMDTRNQMFLTKKGNVLMLYPTFVLFISIYQIRNYNGIG